MVNLRAPINNKQKLSNLKVGQLVYFSGTMFTARDQAHKQLIELIKKRKRLPFKIKNQLIYYCGPTQTPPGKIIGSCGPTTSMRMDEFSEPLLKKGLIGMIGKGRRTLRLRKSIKKYKAVYFLAPAGCGAYLAKKVISKRIVGFKKLGAEAIYRLEVKDFPLIVGIDSKGRDIYAHLSSG